MSQGRVSNYSDHMSQTPCLPSSVGFLNSFILLLVYPITFIPSNNLYTSLLTLIAPCDSPKTLYSPVLSNYESALHFFQINKFPSGRLFSDNLPFQPFTLTSILLAFPNLLGDSLKSQSLPLNGELFGMGMPQNRPPHPPEQKALCLCIINIVLR